MSAISAVAVKTFISYSWSSPGHESWVLDLASRLREDGVDVILDKWDLQHGHDAYKFMEQMVTDPAVSKVLMICDQKYAEKADKREGGVGAESQIISPELYGKSVQSKFAAAITELDANGNAYVPTFYKGRIHFDFTASESFEIRYEQLLRWLLDKPELVKPSLGKIPAHIASGGIRPTQTDSRLRRATEALRQGSNSAPGLLREFAESFVVDFERYRTSHHDDVEYDDRIVDSIDAAQVSIEQANNLVLAIARFSEAGRLFQTVIGMLEGLGKYMFRPEHVSSWNSWDFDNFKFLCHQLFLSCLALLLKEGRFDLADELLSHRFLIERNEDAKGTDGYNVFLNEIGSLEHRNRRLNLNRASLEADFLKKYSASEQPAFSDLMQADFFLLLRWAVSETGDRNFPYWFAVTAPYMSGRYGPFPNICSYGIAPLLRARRAFIGGGDSRWSEGFPRYSGKFSSVGTSF